MTRQERAKITAKGKDVARCNKKPAARFMPAGYILPPGTEVPRMGSHAVDLASPEFRQQPFTATFVYGFYDGRLRFIEPMVALSFLASKPNFTAPVKLPAAYPQRGYYPTRYSVKYDAVRQEYTVALEGLTLRYGAGK